MSVSAERKYVVSLVEESLGLVSNSVEDSMVPDAFVKQVSEALRGERPEGFPKPALEDGMRSILRDARDASLRRDGFFVRKARWPDGAPFAICLTHDVDNISRPRSHLWRTRSRFSFGDLLGGMLGLLNPYDNIAMIGSRERVHDFRSSFYFLTENYDLRKLRKTASALAGAGHEIGLHGDFGTHDSLEKMQGAVSRFTDSLGTRPRGLREHYLKFDFSKSWTVMQGAGFDYDTTVGNNDHIGFKVGLASPFHPPDGTWSPMELLEIPLVLMDTTLWGYLKRSEEQGFTDFLEMLQTVEQAEGLLTLLWHQEAVRMKGGRMYWRILDVLDETDCFVGSGAQVAGWWRERAVPLINDGKLIRLRGRPPKGLLLELSLSEGRTPVVRSGSMGTFRDGYVIRPEGPDFQLEVAK